MDGAGGDVDWGELKSSVRELENVFPLGGEVIILKLEENEMLRKTFFQTFKPTKCGKIGKYS